MGRKKYYEILPNEERERLTKEDGQPNKGVTGGNHKDGGETRPEKKKLRMAETWRAVGEEDVVLLWNRKKIHQQEDEEKKHGKEA